MADLPLPQIREKKFRQQEIDFEIDLDLFTFRHFPLLHPCLNIFRAIFFKSNHPKD